MAKSYAATWRSTSMYYLRRKQGMVCTTGERLIYFFRLRRNNGPMAKKANFHFFLKSGFWIQIAVREHEVKQFKLQRIRYIFFCDRCESS
jgi:hypothetical protein